jgi:hypothetical protein
VSQYLWGNPFNQHHNGLLKQFIPMGVVYLMEVVRRCRGCQFLTSNVWPVMEKVVGLVLEAN